MNRYPLNARTLGAGISVPQIYWSAVVDIIVFDSYAEFTQYTGVLVQSMVTMSVSTTVSTIRSAAISAYNTFAVDITANVTRIQRMAAQMNATVSSSFTAIAGLLKFVTSAITFGVDSSVNSTRRVALTAQQVVQDTTTAIFGLMKLWTANQTVQEVSTANFTSFGEYAPAERYIIVDSEDRDTEVN